MKRTWEDRLREMIDRNRDMLGFGNKRPAGRKWGTTAGIDIDPIDGNIAAKRQVLPEVRRRGGFAAAALKIDDGNHLEVLIASSRRNVSAIRLAAGVEEHPQGLNIGERVGAPPSPPNVDLTSVR